MAFVESVLAVGDNASHLRQLCTDPSVLDEILDLKELRQTILENPLSISISPAFYFFILVRHVFMDAGIDDRALADYVAGVMADKMTMAPDSRPGSMPVWATHTVDFLSVIETTSGRLKFHLMVEAGNQFLLLTGLFPAFLSHRASRSGAPDLGFYEDFARNSFRMAADSPLAPRDAPRETFGLLSEVFPVARRSLNRMSEGCLFLGAA